MGLGGEPVWCTEFHGEIPALAASGAGGGLTRCVERNPACAWLA